MDLFDFKGYEREHFDRAVNNVKNKTLDELIVIIRQSLVEAYGKSLKFPDNCCDFSSAFGVFILSKLGYDAEYWTAKVQSIKGTEYGHSFIKVGEKIIDFTIDQFGILKPGYISCEDFISYYEEAWCDRAKTKGNGFATFEQFKDYRSNFVVMIIYQAIEAFIWVVNKDLIEEVGLIEG